ncbi:MAG: iron-containing redox enzyme family protein [Myxococcota bacterium]
MATTPSSMMAEARRGTPRRVHQRSIPDRDRFLEVLLQIMELKKHWAWSGFTSGQVPPEKLHVHLEQEWDVYVRDFPMLIGRAYIQCPFPAVRRDLAENLYEEETGGLAAGRPHPELFLEIPRGLGMDLTRFERVVRGPVAQAYRDLLDECTMVRGWAVAVAVTTLFIEGHAYERHAFDPSAPSRPEPALEDHPLVRHYGLDVDRLALVKAHRSVEGDHRVAAWRMVLDYTPEEDRLAVIASMQQVLAAWLAYRDEVAYACGLARR